MYSIPYALSSVKPSLNMFHTIWPVQNEALIDQVQHTICPVPCKVLIDQVQQTICPVVSWVFHVIFSFVHFISLYTLGGLHAFRKPLPYNMYLFNLRIANHILIKIKIIKISDIDCVQPFLSVLVSWYPHYDDTLLLLKALPAIFKVK